MNDTILCRDKDDAKKVIDAIGGEHIKDWEFLENGKVMIELNCSVKELERKEKNNECLE